MEARGYGQSKVHSRYRPITYSTQDISWMAGGLLAAIAMVAL
jgi:energy-coupling factor transporter transmembrane protein EcfT